MNIPIQKKYSPHYRENRKADIDSIIIHYISAINVLPNDPYNVNKVLDFLTKPIPIGNGKSVRVSSHYLITRFGTIYQMVDEENVAWHSGKSSMPDGRNINNSVNDFSIGIELIGGQWEVFTPEQYRSLIELINDVKNRHDIKATNIKGHCDVSPGRKIDPGKHFDWIKIYNGIQSIVDEIPFTDAMRSVANAIHVTDKEIERVVNGDVPQENNITDGCDALSQMINTTEPKETLFDRIWSFILSLIGK